MLRFAILNQILISYSLFVSNINWEQVSIVKCGETLIITL